MFKLIVSEILKIRALAAVAAYKRRVRAENQAWMKRHFK